MSFKLAISIHTVPEAYSLKNASARSDIMKVHVKVTGDVDFRLSQTTTR
jgi:hypothetical protein